MRYTYAITRVDEDNDVMDVVYSAEGQDDVMVGVPIPREDEDLASVVASYVPLWAWRKAAPPQKLTPGITGAGTIADERPGDNYVWENDQWVQRTEPRHFPLSPAQFHAMVDILGKRQDILRAVEQVYSTPEALAVAKQKFERATVFKFDDPMIEPLRKAAGLTKEQLASAWLQAAQL